MVTTLYHLICKYNNKPCFGFLTSDRTVIVIGHSEYTLNEIDECYEIIETKQVNMNEILSAQFSK